MRNLSVFLSLFFIYNTLSSQVNSTILIGKVLLKEEVILNVHIINKKTNLGSITNDKGVFEIPVKIGDSLYFSHLNLKDEIILITKEVFSSSNFNVQLKEKTYTLKAFTLQKPRSIFYIDKEIMPNNGVLVNTKTLNLPYANTQAKKDNAVFKIRAGGVVNLGNLISRINGDYKQKKRVKKLKNEDFQLQKIRAHFTDDFFTTDLKIREEYINQFLNYCIHKNIITTFTRDNPMQLTQLLIEESRLFPYKIRDEDVFFTNN
jgi:hypothetical protein